MIKQRDGCTEGQRDGGTEVKTNIKQKMKIRNWKIRRTQTGVGCVFSVCAA